MKLIIVGEAAAKREPVRAKPSRKGAAGEGVRIWKDL